MKKLFEKYKKQAALILGAVALAAYLTSVMLPRQVSSVPDLTVMADPDQEMIQVYLLDQDNTLIPYSVSIDQGLELKDRIAKVFFYMTRGNEPVKGVKGVLSSGVTLETVKIEGKRADLHFNNAFNEYDPKIEMRILEAVTWAATQFSEIQEAAIYVNNNLITHMPRMQTPIPLPLNRDIGINNFENSVLHLHESTPITVFYAKESSGKEVYVPKTKRIDKSLTSIEEKVRQIVQDISVSSNLKQPLYVSEITLDSPTLEEGTLIVNVSSNMLDEEKTANPRLYEMLVLSLGSIAQVDRVQLMVDGVTVSVSGANDESVSVSSLRYNIIKL